MERVSVPNGHHEIGVGELDRLSQRPSLEDQNILDRISL